MHTFDAKFQKIASVSGGGGGGVFMHTQILKCHRQTKAKDSIDLNVEFEHEPEC